MPGRPSKMDKLPEEVREALEHLWMSGRYTLDQLCGHLADLAEGRRNLLPPELAAAPQPLIDDLPSRGRMHAHLQGLDKLAARLQNSRAVAEALVKKLGDAPEDRAARLNIELLHSTITDIFLASGDGEEQDAPVTLDPQQAMFLARALKDVSSAKKTDAEATLRLRAETEKKTKAAAVKAAETVARERGLSKETIDNIRAGILGVSLEGG